MIYWLWSFDLIWVYSFLTVANVYNPLPGSGVIHLSFVDCVGNEDSILQCRFSVTTTYATHSDDAGVTCSNDSKGKLYLMIYMIYYIIVY